MELEQRAELYAALGDVARLRLLDALACGDLTPRALGEELSLPGNLLTHHLGVLEAAGLIHRRRSDADRRSSYIQLADRARPMLSPRLPSQPPPRVAFICTHNSARSQLAAALWRRASNIPSVSAGTEPATRVHPGAILAGRRAGVEISAATPQSLDGVLSKEDLVVSVCDNAGRQLPVDHVHWSLPDPVAVNTRAAFDETCAELNQRVHALADIIQGEP